MRGYPGYLNSKEDYLFVREHFPRERWLPDYQALLDSYKDWFFTGHLDKESDGVTDETHKVVSFEDDEQQTRYDQYEFRENPDAKLFRLGFTVDEVKSLMAEEQ